MSTTSPNMAALTTPERLTSPTPGGRWLSNGNYSVLVTRAGTGWSCASDYALTRWTADRIEDRTGFFVFVRDTANGAFFSVTEEPAGAAAESRVFSSSPGRVRFVRQGQGLESRLDVCVLNDRDAELRRLTITNTGASPRTLDVTSWADVVLNHRAADASHPAFSKLFVQTEWDAADATLLARRRPRSNHEFHPWLAHALVEAGPVSWESDRVRFMGREGSPAAPRAMCRPGSLGLSSGNVLDPVVSLRRECALAPGESATFTFVLALAPKRERVLDVVRELRREGAVEEAFTRAAALERGRRQRLHIEAEAAEGLQAIAAAMAYGYSGLRAGRAQQARQVARPGLHDRIGANGFVPLVLAWCENGTATARLRELARACEYWRELGFGCESVGLLAPNAVLAPDLPTIALPASSLGPEDTDALASQAAAVFLSPLSEVAEEVLALESARPIPPARAHTLETAAPATDEPLREWNGFGGFTADGREYVIRMPYDPVSGHRKPPLPWVNIMASERFGFFVSETGAASTWNGNSREHRLTPWHNDPVLDPHGEALHLRDDETGEWWSPAAGPSPAHAAYEMRHGFGYSISRHESHGLAQEVCWFAHEREPVRCTRVRVTNTSGRERRLSLWGYARLVQGVLPEESSRHVVSGRLEGDLALTATNATAGEFAQGVAFSAVVAPEGARHHATADREEYIGVGGAIAAPVAVATGATLSGSCGAGLDPCFADQLEFTLAPGATAECTFLFGEASSETHVRAIVEALRAPGAVQGALEAVRASWERLVSGVQVRTPSPEIDLMVNGWLAYQTLSCRIWGRTAYYQSGGAFGFRDQLQDAASLLHLKPELTRAQIVLNASHQFVEGDVLHWWHPPLSKGMRTRFADDLLWLPLLTAYYLQSTGDWSVLDESARFLTAPALEPGVDEIFLRPADSGTSADVYEHCCLAIDRSLGVGEHGLPLFGTGDWNDGMNRVGREGRGESVWMGFFLHMILGDFISICERRGDQQRAERYERHRDALRVALNDGGWDGEWYRRAYYDDGAPLGSKDSDECRIDGLAQAWSVLSHAAPPDRANQAMDSVEKHLISESDGIIRLLTPAFRDTPHDPGYIKGYVAGVRENGGQYTHGVLWVVRAMAELGRRDRAAALLAMLSPVRHTATPERVARYQTEPYVIVADVYGEAPHVGRGGWTWYTGSAGWMFRIAVESVLGVTLVNGESVRVKPCIPDEWPGYEMDYRIPGTQAVLEIRVSNPEGCSRAVLGATIDGQPVPVKAGEVRVPVGSLTGRHRLELILGAGA